MDERRLLLRLIDAGLTAQQIGRLVALRQRWRTRGSGALAAEVDLDVPRALFARWLVQHGMLSDFPTDGRPG
ncbi:MAG: hypothetical protein C4289_17140 [Chloroflexota bacterium]